MGPTARRRDQLERLTGLDRSVKIVHEHAAIQADGIPGSGSKGVRQEDVTNQPRSAFGQGEEGIAKGGPGRHLHAPARQKGFGGVSARLLTPPKLGGGKS